MREEQNGEDLASPIIVQLSYIYVRTYSQYFISSFFEWAPEIFFIFLISSDLCLLLACFFFRRVANGTVARK